MVSEPYQYTNYIIGGLTVIGLIIETLVTAAPIISSVGVVEALITSAPVTQRFNNEIKL
jgi:hypothetical protein